MGLYIDEVLSQISEKLFEVVITAYGVITISVIGLSDFIPIIVRFTSN
jgi:hypothetical protein